MHGDFNAGNLRVTGGVVKIFDLDDCGYGPPAFDVANALYMVLFDAFIQGAVEIYETFRRSFLAGYVELPGPRYPRSYLDRFIDLRVQRPSRLARRPRQRADRHPHRLRAWHATLRAFVADHRAADPVSVAGALLPPDWGSWRDERRGSGPARSSVERQAVERVVPDDRRPRPRR